MSSLFLFFWVPAAKLSLDFVWHPKKQGKKFKAFASVGKKLVSRGPPMIWKCFALKFPLINHSIFPRSFPRGEDTFVFEAYSPCQEKWENVSFFRSKFAIASTNPLLSWGNSIDFFTIIRFFNRLLRTRLNDEFVARNKKLLLLAVCFASRDNVFVTRSGK